MATLTATPDPTTGSVLIQLDRTIVDDTFTRVVAPGGFGNATPTGGAWTVAPTAAQFSVNGTQGVISTAVVNTTYRAFLQSGLTDFTATVRSIVNVLPLTAPIDSGIMARYDVANTYFYARVRLPTSGRATLSIQHVSGATLTPLTAEIPIAGFTVSAANDFRVTLTIAGNMIAAKAWLNADADPQLFSATAQSTAFTVGAVGVMAMRATGNTNGATNVFYDDFQVDASVEPLNLFRVTPDGMRTLVRGSAFFTAEPANTAVFWDNEAPFDVDIFYTLASVASPTETVTSNIVQLLSNGMAWLRDPYVPANNILLEVEGDIFDFCDDEPRIMFAGLSAKAYESASGVFEIIDAQRPDTVAQIRKRYGSALTLISKELADIDSIETIIAGGYPLLLSLPIVYGFGLPYGTDWVTVLNVSSSAMGVDQRLPARVWSLPFRLSSIAVDVETGNTGGNGIGGGDATFDVLAASAIGLTYNSLTASGLTYDQIAAGTGY